MHPQHAPAPPPPSQQRPPPPHSLYKAPPPPPSLTASATYYKPNPPTSSLLRAAQLLPTSTSSFPPLSLTLSLLVHVSYLFALSSSSSPLLLCLSCGLLATFLLSSVQLHDLSAIVFMVCTTVYSALLFFFHPFAASTSSAVFTAAFLVLTYASLLCFALFFALTSPATSALLPPPISALFLTALYSVLPLLTAAVSILALLPLAGVAHASFFYLALYGGCIKLLLMPSSTEVRGRVVVSPAIVYYHLWMFVFTPCLLHSFVHSAAPMSLSFACDFVLLLTLPFLVLAAISHSTPLAVSPLTGSLYASQAEKERVEVAMAFVAVVVAVACVEYRVVIVSFSSLLYYHASSPWFSTLLLTVFLYSSLTALLLLLTGLTKEPATSGSSRVVAFHASVLVASLSLALTLGLLFLIPVLPLISYAFSSFFFTRSLLSYSAFLASVLLALAYFAYQHFWFLEVDVAGGLSLSSLSLLLIGLALLALLVPALPLIPLPSLLSIYSHSTSFLLLLYLVAFSLVEFLLYSTNEHYPSPIYPPAFPLISTAIGLYVVHLLQSSARINRFTWSVMLSVVVGKLSMLLVDTTTDFVHALLIATAVTSPYTMYVKRMHWLLAVGHAVITAMVLLLGKNTVLAHALRLAGVEAATESTFLSAYLLVTLVALLPLSAPYERIRRVHVLLLGISAVFAALQPRLPSWLFSGESDVFDVQHEADLTYSTWLLMVAAGLFIVGVMDARPVTRVVLNVSGALLLCVYLCNGYLPSSFALYLFFGVVFVSAALIASIVSSPADPALTYPPLVLLALMYCMAFPLTFISTTLLFTVRGYSVEEMEQSRIVLFTTYSAVSLLLSIVVNYHRVTAPPPEPGKPAPFSSFTLSGAAHPHAALTTIANLLLFLSYLASVVLLVHYLHESEAVIVYLAPVLLFISYDGGGGMKGHVGAGAVDQSRYVPMLAISAGLLLLSALGSVFDPLLSPLHSLTPHARVAWSWSSAALEALFVSPSVPLLWYSLVSLASSRLRIPIVVLAITAPLCFVALVLSTLDSVRLLDGMAVLIGGVLYLRASGMK